MVILEEAVQKRNAFLVASLNVKRIHFKHHIPSMLIDTFKILKSKISLQKQCRILVTDCSKLLFHAILFPTIQKELSKNVNSGVIFNL